MRGRWTHRVRGLPSGRSRDRGWDFHSSDGPRPASPARVCAFFASSATDHDLCAEGPGLATGWIQHAPCETRIVCIVRPIAPPGVVLEQLHDLPRNTVLREEELAELAPGLAVA